MSEIQNQKQNIRAAMDAIDLVNQTNFKFLEQYMTLKKRIWEDQLQLQCLKSIDEPGEDQKSFEEFTNAKIEYDSEVDELLKIDDIYLEFKEYYKGTYKHQKLPSRKQIKTFMNEKYPDNTIITTGKNYAWRGLKIKATE